MQIYNTLTRKKEEFKPLEGNKVKMFVCGPTVYDYIHIGNARTFVFFDVVAKYLRFKGFDVEFIQNITDIDDRIIRRAQESGKEPQELAKEYKKYFLEDSEKLGISSVSKFARATEHIPEVIKQVKTLIDTGHAYEIKGDGWYFDLKTFPEYGKLSGRTAEMADDAVSRIDENENKRNRGDFCLWKFSKNNEPSWPAEFGNGRPGWHIEDTAITDKYFGSQYDLHGGGQDLIFPHHEAEIAQQESASGLKPFVKYWMHSAFLVNNAKKMSKSLGNFATAREIIEKYPTEAIRFFLLSAHYRTPLDFNDNALDQAEAAISRIGEFISRMQNLHPVKSGEAGTAKQLFDGVKANDSVDPELSGISEKLHDNIEAAFDDDFNTSKVFGEIFETIKKLNIAADNGKLDEFTAKSVIELLNNFNQVLGIVPASQSSVPDEIKKLADEREQFRKDKNFTESDKLRSEIESLGFEIKDTIYGSLIKKR